MITPSGFRAFCPEVSPGVLTVVSSVDIPELTVGDDGLEWVGHAGYTTHMKFGPVTSRRLSITTRLGVPSHIGTRQLHGPVAWR